jgi:hypothetical protein
MSKLRMFGNPLAMNAKLKKDRLCLLQTLRDFVEDSLGYGETNVQLDSEVAEIITNLTDKRKMRTLKIVRKELQKWIHEIEESRSTSKSAKA